LNNFALEYTAERTIIKTVSQLVRSFTKLLSTQAGRGKIKMQRQLLANDSSNDNSITSHASIALVDFTTDLPDELIIEIFSYLNFKDLKNVESVNKHATLTSHCWDEDCICHLSRTKDHSVCYSLREDG
jgi:hypothetical protein